jgi:hypothetical protein
MADPFGFIGNTLQSAFLPDTEDEEARKYREEYERMRRTLQAQGKPAPPPVYQTRKPKNVFGGLLPEYGAGNLAQKRRGERDEWRKSYDPIAMKRFQDQRKRDELQRDIGKRRQLEQIGGKAGQTPSMSPSFTSAAQKAGWSPAELSILGKRGDSGYRARTEKEESELERLRFEQAGGISATAAAQQARARTPAVRNEQQYLSNYWDAMNKNRVWSSAVEAQESKNNFTKVYNDIKLDFEQKTKADKIALSKVAAVFAKLKQQAYEKDPGAFVDALTKGATKTATEAAEFVSPGAVTQRAAVRGAKETAAGKAARQGKDFIAWFDSVDPSKFPPGFLSEQEWRKVEAIINTYKARSAAQGDTNFEALMLLFQGLDLDTTDLEALRPQPGSGITVPSDINLD